MGVSESRHNVFVWEEPSRIVWFLNKMNERKVQFGLVAHAVPLCWDNRPIREHAGWAGKLEQLEMKHILKRDDKFVSYSEERKLIASGI